MHFVTFQLGQGIEVSLVFDGVFHPKKDEDDMSKFTQVQPKDSEDMKKKPFHMKTASYEQN